MQSRHLALALLAAAAVLAACSDSTSPKLPKTTINLRICPSAVVWVAYKNQNENWAKVDMSPDGAITFDATDKVSFAFAQAVTGIGYTQVLNTTTADLLAVNDMPCETYYGTRSITSTVAGLSGSQTARISGASSIVATSAANTSWTLTDLPSSGGIDVLAVRYPASSTANPDRLILRRGVVPTSYNFPIATIDFAAGEAANVDNQSVTFNNVGTDAVQMESSLWTSNNTLARLELKTVSASPFTFTYAAVPAALRLATDMQRLYNYAYNSTDTRTLVTYFTTPAAKTLTFGPALTAATATTLAQSPYPRMRVTFASQPEYASGARAIFYQMSGTAVYRQVVVTTTTDYMGGLPATWTIEVPDFSTAAYRIDYGLSTGQYYWQANAYQGALRYENRPADGLVVTSAYKTGSVTP